MQDLFVPVLVRNNVEGPERAVCERYEEPSWNNPVVRFLDASGKDVLPRADGIWTVDGIARRLGAALEAAGRTVPGWLALQVPPVCADPGRAVIAMHCFWEGEARLATLPGVVDVRAGWREGAEVVDLRYDRALLDPGQLLERAASLGCLRSVHTDDAELRAQARRREVPVTELSPEPRPASRSDQLHALRETPLVHVPMARRQALRINAALAAGEPTAPWLSPGQRALHERVRATLLRRATALEGHDGQDEGSDLRRRTDELLGRLEAALHDGPGD